MSSAPHRCRVLTLFSSFSVQKLPITLSLASPPSSCPCCGTQKSSISSSLGGRITLSGSVRGNLQQLSATPWRRSAGRGSRHGCVSFTVHHQRLTPMALFLPSLYTSGVFSYSCTFFSFGMAGVDKVATPSPEFSPLFPLDNSIFVGIHNVSPSGSPHTAENEMSLLPSIDSHSDAASFLGQPVSVLHNLDSLIGPPQFTPLQFTYPESYFCNDSDTFYPSLSALATNRARLDMAVIIHVLSTHITTDHIITSIRRQWFSFGPIDIIHYGRRSLLGLFASSQARDAVLQKGPWFVDGRLVGLDRWSPSFDGIYSVIWVRLPHLPFQLWDREHLARFATIAGEPLWLDNSTLAWGTAYFARVAVRAECRVLHKFFVVFRLRCFDDVPLMLDRKLRHFLIGRNDWSSLTLKNNGINKLMGGTASVARGEDLFKPNKTTNFISFQSVSQTLGSVEFCTSYSLSLFNFAASRHSHNVASEVKTFFDRKEQRELACCEGNFLLSRSSSAKFRKSAKPKDFLKPGFTMKRGNFPSTAALIYLEIRFSIFDRLAGFS
ncbi:hypothetical protein M5K25_021466 [Dendrobium thyrsiflorum]|uniref:DUF4283 domain-containing protein n=1 Tax=Dendrobium thyrsiflorum TaxID=117978 RepID=A0ABD0UCW3_DENTH